MPTKPISSTKKKAKRSKASASAPTSSQNVPTERSRGTQNTTYQPRIPETNLGESPDTNVPPKIEGVTGQLSIEQSIANQTATPDGKDALYASSEEEVQLFRFLFRQNYHWITKNFGMPQRNILVAR